MGGRGRLYTIYKYTNSSNGKVYIGQTSKTLPERAGSNGRNYIACNRFYAAIKKYGWDAFVPEVLETVETVEEANEREIHYIDLFSSTDERYGYNILAGGTQAPLSEAGRAAISIKAKERYKDKTANPMYGKKHSESALEKQRAKKRGCNNPMYGTTWTDIQREKCGTAGKTLNLSDEQRDRLRANARHLGSTTGLRPVRCIEDDVSFCTLTEAANAYGVKKSTLCGHLGGYQNTCSGKHFEYVN